ncbi:MAG: hypothetical protein MI806_23145 [Minwuiales bacterium]|nr:hypothetical protein [Minwuiales bacterium]
MFGFSLTKLLFTAAIIAAVWYAFKFVGRLNAGEKNKGREKVKARATKKSVEDLVQCPVCETFVQADGGPCERADCPR